MALKHYIFFTGMMLVALSSVDASMKCFRFNHDSNNIKEGLHSLADNVGLTSNCPMPLLGDSSKEFCCYDVLNWFEAECCDFGQMVLNWSIIAVILLIILMLVSTVVSCICCLCCPCCFLYKRRQGRAYRSEPIIAKKSTTNRTVNNEYTPIAKSNVLPPGAFPIFPPGTEKTYYTRSQS